MIMLLTIHQHVPAHARLVYIFFIIALVCLFLKLCHRHVTFFKICLVHQALWVAVSQDVGVTLVQVLSQSGHRFGNSACFASLTFETLRVTATNNYDGCPD